MARKTKKARRSSRTRKICCPKGARRTKFGTKIGCRKGRKRVARAKTCARRAKRAKR